MLVVLASPPPPPPPPPPPGVVEVAPVVVVVPDIVEVAIVVVMFGLGLYKITPLFESNATLLTTSPVNFLYDPPRLIVAVISPGIYQY